MRSWELPYRPLLFVFAAAAAAAAGLSLPDERETLALLERDGRISAVLERVRAHMTAPRPDPFILQTAVRLHLQSGDREAALAAAELHAAARPDSLHAQVQLLDLLREPRHYERHVALAERIVDRWVEPNVLANLLRHYRLNRQFSAEARLLQVAAGTGYATAADIERLGMILATQGDYASATQLLLDGDSTRVGIDRQARVTLFHLLVEQGRAEEAVRRATNWLAARPDDADAAQFCGRLAVAGDLARAEAMTQYAGHRADAIYSACIEWALKQRYTDVAIRLLETWQTDHRAASGEVVGRFIQSGLQLARPDIALQLWAGARAYALSFPTCLAATLAAARMAASDGVEALAPPVRRLLILHIRSLQMGLARISDRELGPIDRNASSESLGQLAAALGGDAASLRIAPLAARGSDSPACKGENDDN